MNIRTYSELITIPTFEERYNYLKLNGIVGKETFGYDRYLNQLLYRSSDWRSFRDRIIIRDNGCDLACEGFELQSRIIIHHIDPITVEDIINKHPKVFDPENVVSTSHNTHLAIHYGDKNLISIGPINRYKNDTCPWKHQNNKK